MEFKSIMHASYYVNDIDRTIDFYQNVLGLKLKMLVKNKSYLDKPNSPFYKFAKEDPERICLIYFEVVPGQFIEFFPKMPIQKPHTDWNEHVGFSHIALLVDDIFKTKEELIQKGVKILIDISIGNSRTYQMWIADPDDNRIEIMQFTDESYQIIGHIDE